MRRFAKPNNTILYLNFILCLYWIYPKDSIYFVNLIKIIRKTRFFTVTRLSPAGIDSKLSKKIMIGSQHHVDFCKINLFVTHCQYLQDREESLFSSYKQFLVDRKGGDSDTSLSQIDPIVSRHPAPHGELESGASLFLLSFFHELNEQFLG